MKLNLKFFQQKELFGKASRFLRYKECSPAQQRNFSLCANDNITGVPTWEFADGTRLQGVQSLETLATQAGCLLQDPDSALPTTIAPGASSSAPVISPDDIIINEGDNAGVSIKNIEVK